MTIPIACRGHASIDLGVNLERVQCASIAQSVRFPGKSLSVEVVRNVSSQKPKHVLTSRAVRNIQSDQVPPFHYLTVVRQPAGLAHRVDVRSREDSRESKPAGHAPGCAGAALDRLARVQRERVDTRSSKVSGNGCASQRKILTISDAFILTRIASSEFVRATHSAGDVLTQCPLMSSTGDHVLLRTTTLRCALLLSITAACSSPDGARPTAWEGSKPSEPMSVTREPARDSNRQGAAELSVRR